jgi:hypothetical protein
MPNISNANAVALQLEKVRPELPLLWAHDDTLLGLIEDKTDGLEQVSTRTYRIPVNISAGGGPSQINPDGGNLPRGSNFKTDVLLLNQVYFAFPMEYTAEMKIATDSKQKAIENYVAEANQLGSKTFRTGLEALLQGDGSGTLDSVTSIVNSPVIGVNNANQFIDQQYVQDFPNLTSASRGTMLIMMSDAIANTLTIDPSTPVPAGIAIGDLLIVDGGAGVANSSLNGLQALQLNSSIGAYLGVQRAAWPGRLSCPLIAGNSTSITPQRCRLILNQTRLALGIDTPETAQWFWYMLVDQEAAIENIGLIVSQVIQNQLKGDSSVDMLMKTAPKTFGGRPIKTSQHGIPGRIDGIAAKHWGRAMIQPVDYYDVNGQTIFPVYGDNSVPSTGFIVWWWIGFNVFNDNPRAGAYSTGNLIPTGYYGH